MQNDYGLSTQTPIPLYRQPDVGVGNTTQHASQRDIESRQGH
ncbi:hypothetical protein CABS01_14013 [Colletotrichum abscissum]|nr:uncharacterized protein CABS01_14013 [Colletotrichum abscissum]KAK1482315.1 hypothetical protein CABS01_14013 [Colletotrichum abscissum]